MEKIGFRLVHFLMHFHIAISNLIAGVRITSNFHTTDLVDRNSRPRDCLEKNC